MSQIEAATSYAGWRFVLKLNGLQPQEEKCYHVVSSKTGSQDWLAVPSLPNICRWEAWKEWAPFSWRSCKRSWHNFAAAKDQTPEPQLHQKLRWRLQGKGLPVSQWHFLPQGTGTFPAAYLGASSLCVCCVAMLVLPPKSCKSNATFQVRNVQAAADIMYC